MQRSPSPPGRPQRTPAVRIPPAASIDRVTARPWWSVAAAAFVCLALVALAATPLFTFRRLDTLHAEDEATTHAAAADLVELRLLYAEQVARHQTLRAGDDALAAPRYAAVRAHEGTRLAHLAQLAPQIGPAVPGAVARLRALDARWHAAPDARAAGRLAEDAFRLALPAVIALHDSTLDAHARLAAEVQRLDTRHHGGAMRAITAQRRLSAVLGVLALVAAAVVADLARRERRLTHALARAVADEQRLRAEADRQRAEAERQREAVLRIAESKARLVRGFTHDVKNPIGAADGYLALLEDAVPDPATPAQRGYIERARRSLRAALHLIGDLLAVAHAESGAIAVRPVPTDLAAVARDAAEEYRAEAERKGLRLEVVLEDGPATVTTDPVRVRQVLGNLISNAVKYTGRGHIAVRLLGARAARARAERGAEPAPRGDPPRYAIEVSDTGAGIAPEQQALLFEEFVRLAPDAAPGVGLGLAISRRIAQALGGELAVRSAPGQGSTFVLWLPAPPDARALEGAVTGPASMTRDSGVRREALL